MAHGQDSIPVIDISRVGGEPNAVQALAAAIRQASVDPGFFYVTGHTVRQETISRALDAATRFFALNENQKKAIGVNRNHRGYIGFGKASMYGKNLPDLKESFKWGYELSEHDPDVRNGTLLLGPNQWPACLPELRETVYVFYLEMMRVAQQVLLLIAISLNVPEDTFLRHYTKPLARGGILHYPTQPVSAATNQFGVAPHTDYGVLTVLWQDDNGGLEVQNSNGDWISAQPIENSFVINIGDLLQRWTNDRYASNPHRVINRSGNERYSMILFYDPDPCTPVDPAELALPDGTAAKYPPITCGDYIKARFVEAFDYSDAAA